LFISPFVKEKPDFSSSYFNSNNVFIPSCIDNLNYGGCSLMVKRTVVDYNFLLEKESSRSQRKLELASQVDKLRKTRVRFSPSTLPFTAVSTRTILNRKSTMTSVSRRACEEERTRTNQRWFNRGITK
jgi:hypothetical protein